MVVYGRIGKLVALTQAQAGRLQGRNLLQNCKPGPTLTENDGINPPERRASDLATRALDHTRPTGFHIDDHKALGITHQKASPIPFGE
jgi:hypothetical protein